MVNNDHLDGMHLYELDCDHTVFCHYLPNEGRTLVGVRRDEDGEVRDRGYSEGKILSEDDLREKASIVLGI